VSAAAPFTRLDHNVWAAAFILRVPEGSEDTISLVARVSCSNLVLAECSVSLPSRTMGAMTTACAARPLFSRVFVSYARKELWVVQLVNSVVTALQVADLRYDLKFLLAGDDWEQRVREEILTADSFQLFWSVAAKRSREVRKEWRLATERNVPGFIRPVYWEDPLAPPPRELKHLHFARILLPQPGPRS
jgi:hypothetical protein